MILIFFNKKINSNVIYNFNLISYKYTGQYTNKLLKDLENNMYFFLKKYNNRLLVNGKFVSKIDYLIKLLKNNNFKFKPYNCQATRGENIGCDSNGNLCICTKFIYSDKTKFTLGNINDGFFSSKKLDFNIEKINNKKCINCQYKYFCSFGFCLYNNYQKYNDIYHMDDLNCKLNKAIAKSIKKYLLMLYPELIQQLYKR